MSSKKKDSGASVQIFARVRKLMPWEPTQISVKILNDQTIQNQTDKTTSEYQFSHVFNMQKTNEDMYRVMCKPLVRKVLEGYNAVLIAYGQTGSGKTYTLLGKPNLNLKGVLPLSLEAFLAQSSVTKIEVYGVEAYGTHVSRVELFDLFHKANLDPDWTKKKGNSQMDPKKATKRTVETMEQCWNRINEAHDSSHFAPTGKNPESSRGHAAFISKITQDIEGSTLVSYFVVVDLAGSEGESAFTPEFVKKVDSATLMARRLEAGCINNGLSQLQIVFNELKVKGKLSKVQGTGLRRILHSYINKKCVISVLFTLSPAKANSTTTASTLKFAVQAGMVKVKPVKSKKKINYAKLVKDLQEHIKQSDKIIEDLNDRVEELTDKIDDLELNNEKLKKSLESAKSKGVKFDLPKENKHKKDKSSLMSPRKIKRVKSKMNMQLTLDIADFEEVQEYEQKDNNGELTEEEKKTCIAQIDMDKHNEDFDKSLNRHKTTRIDVTLLNQAIKNSISQSVKKELEIERKDSSEINPNVTLIKNDSNNDYLNEDYIKDKTLVNNMTDGSHDTNEEVETLAMNNMDLEVRMVNTNKLNREQLIDYCDELEAKLIEEKTLRKSLEGSQQILIDHLMETNEALLKWFQMKKIL